MVTMMDKQNVVNQEVAKIWPFFANLPTIQ